MIKMIYSCVQLYQQREFLSKRRIMVSVYVHHLTIREGLSTLEGEIEKWEISMEGIEEGEIGRGEFEGICLSIT